MENEDKLTKTTSENIALQWGVDLEGAMCERCEWAYLLPIGSLPLQCPHCFQAELIPFEITAEHTLYNQAPELYLPFIVSQANLKKAIEKFTTGIPFAPVDLKAQTLQSRIQHLYLPMWLLDSDVEATWQAEVGFDYQVLSHQEAYNQNTGKWVSKEQKETRIRWEPRLGRLTRTYHNVPLPALEDDFFSPRKLGAYKVAEAEPYQTSALNNALVRLPTRPPEDVWPDALPLLRQSGREECREAAGADHIQDFRWKANYHNRNWTHLLLPLYSTYYFDDNDTPHPVLIHGQSARLIGSRRASMARARQVSLIIGIVAALVFGCALLVTLAAFFDSSFFMLGGFGVLVAVFMAVLALVPMGMVWWFNRTSE